MGPLEQKLKSRIDQIRRLCGNDQGNTEWFEAAGLAQTVLHCPTARRLNSSLGEQPARLRILGGESPPTVSCPKRTVSISTARGGNKPR